MAIINKGMSRRSFLGLTGSVAAVAGLGLTGCGGSSSDEGSASGSTDSANRGGGVITAGSAYARPASIPPAPAPLWAWVLTGTSSRASRHRLPRLQHLQRARHRRSQVCGRHHFRGHHPQGCQVPPMAPRSPLTMSLPPTPLAPLPLPMLRSSSPSSPSRPRTPAP